MRRSACSTVAPATGSSSASMTQMPSNVLEMLTRRRSLRAWASSSVPSVSARWTQ